MNSQTPNGLSRAVLGTILPIRDELVSAGWVFGVIQWDNERQRMLSFTVVSPDGKSGYIACEENTLVHKLEQLLDSN